MEQTINIVLQILKIFMFLKSLNIIIGIFDIMGLRALDWAELFFVHKMSQFPCFSFYFYFLSCLLVGVRCQDISSPDEKTCWQRRHGILRKHSLRKICSRVWKDMWNFLNSRCERHFPEWIAQKRHCFNPHLAFYHNLMNL